MTYVATANAFVRAGWEVYIADTDAHGSIDMKKIPSIVSVYRPLCWWVCMGQC
jgi:dTDP-4-amino-4,6-dideoxygalactose transaminase